MIVNLLLYVISYLGLQSRLYSNSVQPKWQLWSAVCLQRFAVITPDMTEDQQWMSEYLTRYDHRRSLKSDHELYMMEDA